MAYRAGVTTAVVAPKSTGPGLSAAFSTGAVDDGLLQEVAALHVSIAHVGAPSVSTQIATLRKLLLDKVSGDLGSWFWKAREVSNANTDLYSQSYRI